MGKWLFLAEFVLGTALIVFFFAGLGQPGFLGLDQTQLFELDRDAGRPDCPGR